MGGQGAASTRLTALDVSGAAARRGDHRGELLGTSSDAAGSAIPLQKSCSRITSANPASAASAASSASRATTSPSGVGASGYWAKERWWTVSGAMPSGRRASRSAAISRTRPTGRPAGFHRRTSGACAPARPGSTCPRAAADAAAAAGFGRTSAGGMVKNGSRAGARGRRPSRRAGPARSRPIRARRRVTSVPDASCSSCDQPTPSPTRQPPAGQHVDGGEPLGQRRRPVVAGDEDRRPIRTRSVHSAAAEQLGGGEHAAVLRRDRRPARPASARVAARAATGSGPAPRGWCSHGPRRDGRTRRPARGSAPRRAGAGTGRHRSRSLLVRVASRRGRCPGRR